jgi:hypothetical protein
VIPRDNDLGPLVRTIMESRAERMVFVAPDTGIEYGRLVEALGILRNATPDLRLAVLSGKLREEFIRRGFPICEISGLEEKLIQSSR